MPPTLLTIHPSSALKIQPQPLTPPGFSPYGTAILSPLFQDLHKIPIPPPSPKYVAHQPPAVVANQSTALKYPSISPLLNNYPSAPSSPPTTAKAQMSLFSCFPRRDLPVTENGSTSFPVRILERHPYTTQTFTPLCPLPSSSSSSSSSASQSPTAYLVIVAPSLHLPATGTTPENPPDLSRLEAFIVNDITGAAAVTYAAGTWHAPMVVLGGRRVDFVVTQFVSGVAEEDCQEVLVGEGVGVDVSALGLGGKGNKGKGEGNGLWKKERRAKL